MMQSLQIMPVPGLPEIRPGDDLAGLVIEACHRLDRASRTATCWSCQPEGGVQGRGPAGAGLIPTTPRPTSPWSSRNRLRVVRRRGDLIISETRHGFVCASGRDRPVQRRARHRGPPPRGLRPLGPAHPRRHHAGRNGRRRWRSSWPTPSVAPGGEGLTDVAIGCAGIKPVLDLRGTDDAVGRELQVTEVCHRRRAGRGGRAGAGQGHRYRGGGHPGRRPVLLRRGVGGRRHRPPPERGPVPMTGPSPTGRPVR